MKILATFSPDYRRIKRLCSISLHHIKIEQIFKEIFIEEPVVWRELWYEYLKKKIIFYLDHMTRNLSDRAICCSDVDILYFNKDELLSDFDHFIESDMDILACRENMKSRDINSGFFMIKNSQQTRNLLKNVIDMDLKKFRLGDQDAINVLLNSEYIHILKYGFLDKNKYVLNCQFKKNINSYEVNKEKIVLFHANCCRSRRKKYIAIQNFRNFMN